MSQRNVTAFRPILRPPASAPPTSNKPTVCSTNHAPRASPSRTPPARPSSANRRASHPNPTKHTHAITRFAKVGNLTLLKNAVRAARADNYHLNAVNYTTIANAHAEHGRPEHAFDVLADMREARISPTNVTLRVALKAASKMHVRRDASSALSRTLAWAREAGTTPCVRTWNMYMQTFVRWNQLDAALAILRCMCVEKDAPRPDVWSFNQCVTALGRAHRLHDALALVGNLLCRGVTVRPDAVTYNALLEAAVCHQGTLPCASGGGGEADEGEDAEALFVDSVARSMRRQRVALNMVTETLMLRVLSRKGASPPAALVRRRVDAVFSNMFLSAAVDKKYFDAALTALGMAACRNDVSDLFDEMCKRRIRPDHLTVRALLVGATRVADVGLARQVVRICNQQGAMCDDVAYTCAIAACARATPCDRETADALLADAAHFGTVWSPAMINAAISCNGDDVQHAVALWKRLRSEGSDEVRMVLSDRVVYDALFRVCGRGGRPDMALRVWYAAKNAQHLHGNSPASRCLFNAFMKGVVENDMLDVVENHLLRKNYMRLLRTECGVRDDFEWPIERIRIKF